MCFLFPPWENWSLDAAHVPLSQPQQRNWSQEQVLIYSVRILTALGFAKCWDQKQVCDSPKVHGKMYWAFSFLYLIWSCIQVRGRTLTAMTMAPRSRGTHLNIVVGEVKGPNSYTEQTTLTTNLFNIYLMLFFMPFSKEDYSTERPLWLCWIHNKWGKLDDKMQTVISGFK